MDLEKYDFEKLAQLIERYNLTEIKFVQGDTKVVLKRNNNFNPKSNYYNITQPQDYEKSLINEKEANTNIEELKHITAKKIIQDEIVFQNEPNTEKTNVLEKKAKNKVENDNYIKSPIAGIFYRQSSPGKPPYVEKGQKIKKGDTVCIVEAMKMITEVYAPFDGIIKEILIENEQFVEFETPLIVFDKD